MDAQLDDIYYAFQADRIDEQEAIEKIRQIWSSRRRTNLPESALFEQSWESLQDFSSRSNSDANAGVENDSPVKRIFVFSRDNGSHIDDFSSFCDDFYTHGADCIVLSSDAEDVERRYSEHTIELLGILKDWFAQRTEHRTVIHLCILDREGIDSSSEESALSQESLMQGLFGALLSAAQEDPLLEVQLTEFDQVTSVNQLVDGIKTIEGLIVPQNARIRLMDGVHYLASWKRQPSNALQKKSQHDHSLTDHPWKESGVYLITGGLGGLGLIFAKDIAKKANDVTLILIGRSDLQDAELSDVNGSLMELKTLEANCVYHAVDVTDQQAVCDSVSDIMKQYGKLTGVIHAAGIIRDDLIVNKQFEQANQVLAPKVAGLVQLDKATRDIELDMFVLFSSLSGAFGNVGQADYAAANGFMDAYAYYRNSLVSDGQRHGLTMSINWPYWLEGGMPLSDLAQEILRQKTGLVPMQTHAGLEAFYAAFSMKKEQAVIVEGDLEKISRELFSHENSSSDSQSVSSSVKAQESILMDAPDRPVQAFLMRTLAAILNVTSDCLDMTTPLKEFGCDLVSLSHIGTCIQKEYGIERAQLALTLGSNIDKIEQHIIASIGTTTAEARQPNSVVLSSESGSLEANNNETGFRRQLHEQANRYFVKMFSSSLKLPVDRIDVKEPLEAYGVDSLMVLEMTNSLEKVFGSLSKTLFFEYQTLDELSLYFVNNYGNKMVELVGLQQSNALPGVDADRPTDIPATPRKLSLSESRKRIKPSSIRSRASNNSSSNREDSFSGSHTDDIAIIGLSGRYPMARSVDQFWENLEQGKDCITELPKDRWNHDLYFDSKKNELGKSYSKWGGFIDGVDEFDPLFFNISPNDAKLMDPQERLFLQCVYETIEDAGYTRSALAGTGVDGNVGVYVGAMYQQYQLYGSQVCDGEMSAAVSCNTANIANRISYFCNFNGPSMALDTMCSSSLTTLHLACQSLRAGESKLAIAGGVNVSVHPNKYVMLSQGHFVSSKGRCESFGEGGEGYVPGEGVGAVLLKPLQKAIADGDHIHGIVKGTSVNHGGRANGYTVPNPNSQASVIRGAFKRAGIDPRTVSYMEAHGTGTSLGDPIEMAGLQKVFSESTDDVGYCAIGSVKSNIGHCESAAGIAGITKVLLQMKHEKIVSSLHSSTLNPNIDFDRSAFVVQQELEDWARPKVDIDGTLMEYPRTAGISSFGAGGSNAHVILQEYVSEDNEQHSLLNENQSIIVLSARTDEGLRRKVGDLINVLKHDTDQQDLADIAYTLQVGREPMNHRIAMIVSSKAALLQNLEGVFQQPKSLDGIFIGNVREHKETISVLSDTDTELVVQAWIEKKKYSRLLTLWVKGLEIDWLQLYPGAKPNKIALPSYPFERGNYWVEHASMQVQGAVRNLKSVPSTTVQVAPIVTSEETRANQDFFYQTDWRLVEKSIQPDKDESETVRNRKALIVYEKESQRLVDAIARCYDDRNTVFIQLAEANLTLSERSWEVNRSDIEQHLVSHLSGFEIEELYFVNVNCELSQSPLDVASEQSRADALFQIIKGLNKLKFTNRSLSLKVVTQDVYQLPGRDRANAPYGASLPGLAQTLCNEYAKVAACCIDLSGSPEFDSQDYMQNIASILAYQNTYLESAVYALRGTQKFERYFKTVELPATSSVQGSYDPYKHEGVYVIIGGATGIGLQLAKYLASNYQARIVITGRSSHSDEKQSILSELASLGGDAIYISADVTDQEDVQGTVNTATKRFGQINGVVHSAAVLRDVMLDNMDKSVFNSVMAPKVQGSLNVAKVTENEDLDFIAFFSSVAGFAGMPGQANYAAAATFQDSFASFLDTQRNYPVRVIDWGFWSEVGMAANDYQSRKFAAQGILPIGTQEGIDGIKRVLMQSQSQIIAFKATQSVLTQLGVSQQAVSPASRVNSVAQFPTEQTRPESNDISTSNKSESVVRSLLEEFSTLSGIPINDIDLDAEWDELGIDSIKIMSMLSTIESRWNIKIYPNELQEYSSFNRFSDYLVGEINASVLEGRTQANVDSDVVNPEQALRVQEDQPDIHDVMLADFCELSGITAEQLDADASWEEMGIDSINMMSMLERIQARWGIRVYPNELQEYSTFAQFSTYLADEIKQKQQSSNDHVQDQRMESPADALPIVETPVNTTTALSSDTEKLNPINSSSSRKPVLYVLSTPRAGSTLLRVMLMGNYQIFSPPELHLLPFDSCKQRSKYLTEHNRQFLGEGFIETMAELENLSAEEARLRVKQLEEQDMPIGDVYGMLQDLAEGRYVVDKSPSYASELEILQRAETISQDSLYIFLIRHPLSVMESFVRNRFDKLLGIDVDPWEYAENLWQTYNRNLLCFLESVSQERQCLIWYEDLVTNPEEVLRPLCEKMGIPFDPNMMKPYEGERMTKGLHEHSMTVGDPNFSQRSKIDPTLANAWQKQKEKLSTLKPQTLLLASELGYDVGHQMVFPLLPAQQNFMQSFGHSPGWNLVQKTFHKGEFDVDNYRHTLQKLVEENSSLRVSFEQDDAQWFQRINEGVRVHVDYEDLSQVDVNEHEHRVYELEMRLNQHLSIDAAPLLRSTVAKLGADSYQIILVVHHLVADGITLGLINRKCMPCFDSSVQSAVISSVQTTHQDDAYLAYIKETQSFLNYSNYVDFWQKQVDMQTKERVDYFLDKNELADTIASERAYTSKLKLADLGITDLKSKSKFFEYISVALYSSIAKWTDDSQAVITHRLHRRDLESPNHYFSTMGWFAGDIVLGLDVSKPKSQQLTTFRSLFESVPLGGTGYELLSNNNKIAPAHEVAPCRLNFQPEMPKGHLSNSDVFLYESEEHERQYLIDLIVRVGREEVTFIVRYSSNRHKTTTIESFVFDWLAELTQVINEDLRISSQSEELPIAKVILPIENSGKIKAEDALGKVENKKRGSRFGKLINPIYSFRAAYERRRSVSQSRAQVDHEKR